jgi:restriction system protein
MGSIFRRSASGVMMLGGGAGCRRRGGFSGSLGANKANKGVFVTTSYFTKPAQEFAERHPFKIVLIDGAELAQLMIRHCVGVRTTETLLLKKIDDDFFPEE